jgi:hypothetical protein
VAFRDWSDSRKRQVRQGGAAVGLVLGVAVAFYVWHGASPPASDPATQSDTPSATSAKPRAVPDDPDMPNPKADLAIQAIANARQLAADGKFVEAEAELKKAEDAVPDMAQIKAARDEIALMQTPQGQLRIQFDKAEFAIERNDAAAAEAALAKAEQLAPQSTEIAPLRQRLQELQQRKLQHDNRVTALLTTMREAIVRQDFAAANDALNQAARLDIGNPEVLKARVELNRAHNEALKKEADKPVPSPTAPR